MLPYVWPKGNMFLQLTVVACLVILAIGRVLNVFVPLYSKYIGESSLCAPLVQSLCPSSPVSVPL